MSYLEIKKTHKLKLENTINWYSVIILENSNKVIIFGKYLKQ